MMPDRFDAVVIGAGQGGTPLARALASAGRRTALIERAEVGGSCVNVGCTPTKTMVASARIAYLSRRAARYGIHPGPVSVDLPEVVRRKREIVESFRGGDEKRIQKTKNLDLIRGEARFIGPKSLEVRRTGGPGGSIASDLIVINTGCRPSVPSLEGLDTVAYLDSTTIIELEDLPRRLLILGGGFVALEFAQMFRRFGSEVVILQRAKQLAEREDPDVADEIRKILEEDGIEVLLESAATRVRSGPNGVLLDATTPAGERTLGGSRLLIAAGRTPNTESLGAESGGVRLDDRGFVQVDERLETNIPGIYAIGDVKGGPAFTHISYDDFRILRTNVLGAGGAKTAGRFVPSTVFTDPQLGRIGMSETEARAAGRRIRVAKLPMTSVARCIETGETRGFLKAVVDGETKEILGAAALCMEGGEIMAVLQVAMMGRLPFTALRDATFAHPTLAESLNNLFMLLGDAA